MGGLVVRSQSDFIVIVIVIVRLYPNPGEGNCNCNTIYPRHFYSSDIYPYPDGVMRYCAYEWMITPCSNVVSFAITDLPYSYTEELLGNEEMNTTINMNARATNIQLTSLHYTIPVSLADYCPETLNTLPPPPRQGSADD